MTRALRLVLLLPLVAGCAAAPPRAAIATFDVEGERFRVRVTNARTIEQLTALREGRSNARIPNGRILRGPGVDAHNAPWSWHLDPEDIAMAEVTIELCDGRPSHVEQNLDEYVDRVGRYCPWSATLIALEVR